MRTALDLPLDRPDGLPIGAGKAGTLARSRTLGRKDALATYLKTIAENDDPDPIELYNQLRAVADSRAALPTDHKEWTVDESAAWVLMVFSDMPRRDAVAGCLCFLHHRVHGAVLGELTPLMLEKIGVSRLGDQLQLLRAIRILAADGCVGGQ